MNDIEIRRCILQFAYDHKLDYQLRHVSTKDMRFLKDVKQNLIIESIRYLKDQGLIKTEDSAWTTISITTDGIVLVEDREEFDRRFPVTYTMPELTKKLVDSVEEMLSPKYAAPLGQFKKAKAFLYDEHPPDYLNSIKEVVGAVEGVARTICGQPKATLSELIPVLKQSHLSHPAMAKLIGSVYAVRGDEPGIAHGASETSSFAYADAELIFNVSASIMIYLVRKTAGRQG